MAPRTKNKSFTELKRYLAEVSVDRRTLDLRDLSKRVFQAYQSRVPSLDICELFFRYAQSSPKYKASEKFISLASDHEMKQALEYERSKRTAQTPAKCIVYPEPRSRLMILRDDSGPEAV